jgi:hypothetical protein
MGGKRVQGTDAAGRQKKHLKENGQVAVYASADEEGSGKVRLPLLWCLRCITNPTMYNIDLNCIPSTLEALQIIGRINFFSSNISLFRESTACKALWDRLDIFWVLLKALNQTRYRQNISIYHAMAHTLEWILVPLQ